MSMRSRRANAGNRLSLLLAEQTPLNDEESELFAERDDDEDFDLDAEEERQRQIAEAASSDNAQGSENDGDGSNGNDEDEEGSESEHDDSNFSDSTDDSEIENDVEPADAGEKELAKEQRVQAREKRIAERNKIFTIKRRAPKQETSGSEQRKKRVFTSADVLLEGRHSSRKSALKNKQHLIEQMREVEERRARYVPPKRQKQPKLTQEQRLEETKKTEIRNLASLNKFVELEEERKLQQRLAMISKRPKLTHFVRFRSVQYLSEPKLIEILPEKSEEDVQIKSEFSSGPTIPSDSINSLSPGTNEDSSGQKLPIMTESSLQESNGISPPQMGVQKNNVKETDSLKINSQESNLQRNDSQQSDPQQSDPQRSDPQQSDPQQSDPQQTNHTLKNESPSISQNNSFENGDKTIESAVGPKVEIEPQSHASEPDQSFAAPVVKNELGSPFEEPEAAEDGDIKEEQVGGALVTPVQGPTQLKTYDFLTLHEFPDVSMNKYAARNIILGRIASKPAHMPAKRMCPFSGLPAKYLDPSTGVAYYGLEASKLLKLASENKLSWNKELGGVFLGATGNQRHAKGVPEGFT